MSSSSLSVGISIVRSVAGVGILAMPYALRQAGYVPATVLFVLVWGMSTRTMIQVCQCALALNRSMTPFIAFDGHSSLGSTNLLSFDPKTELIYNDDGEDDVVTIVEICAKAFGKTRGTIFALGALLPAQWVVAVNYMIFLGDNTSRAFLGNISSESILLCVTLVLCLLCAPRSTEALVYTSLFGNVAFVSGFGIILYYALFQHSSVAQNMSAFQGINGSFEAYGILIFGFSAHAEALAVLTSASSTARRNIGNIILTVQTFLLALFLIFSFSVYAAFGNATQAITFDNLPQSNVLIQTVRICMTLMVATTYPLTMAPFFQVIEESFVDAGDTCTRISSRSFIIFTTLAGAYLCGHSFGPVVALGGGVGAILVFVIPPICHSVMFPAENRGTWSKWANLLTGLVGGIGGLLFSLLGGFYDITSHGSTHPSLSPQAPLTTLLSLKNIH